MINTIIFDYGKVISIGERRGNPREDMAKAFEVKEEEIKTAIGKHIQLFRTGKVNEAEFWRLMGEILGKPVPNETGELWRKTFRQDFKVDQEMLEYVRNLKTKGIKVGVLSNNIPPWVEIIRDSGGFTGFDAVINSCEVGFAKPDPEIYKLALEKLDSKPEETLFIDDRTENLEPARQLGMQVLLATDRASVLKGIEDSIQPHPLDNH